MAFIFDQTTRPDRLVSEKGKEYHLEMAKYCLFSGYNGVHQKWLRSIYVNKNFYKGNQWSLPEDKETFLMDTTGNISTRIGFVQNTIRPMVEQYRGNAIILNVNAVAKSISKEAVNRRDKKLAEQLFKTKVANEFDGLGKIMREKDISIGNDEGQTQTIFDNLYVDKLTEEINDLINYSKRINKFQGKQIKVAIDLALTGLAVQQSILHGGHQRFETIEAEDFFFDRDAREYDLSDAEFQGTMTPMDIPLILERWQLDPKDANSIEQYAINNGDNQTTISGDYRTYSSGKMPVVTVYWKDSERYKYGYVLDEFGYPTLERIGERKDDSKLDQLNVYTEADLITPPDTPKNRRLFPNGAKTAMLYCDVLRYCSYIPSEIVSGERNPKDRKFADIVLEYGKEPYQETSYQDLSNVKFPFKCYTWGFVDGEIFSPVDDAIDPQRFLNRILSLTEQRFNSSGGTNVILDEDSVDDMAETMSDIKESKPIFVRSRGKGIPNTVGYYDASPKGSTYDMFGVATAMKNMIQDTTGVNEGLKGESTGGDQLVGVTKLMIQRGSIMQEPFYNAVFNVFYQMYESVASVGKKFYIDNERELSIISGDDATKVFKLSGELRNEDFLIFVERENPEEMLVNQANQMLMTFKEMGLVDDVIFANLYGRSTPEKVMYEIRSATRIKLEAQKRAEQQQAQEQQAMMQQEQQMIAQQEQMDQQQNASKEANKLRAIELQNQGKVDQIMTKALLEGNNQGVNG